MGRHGLIFITWVLAVMVIAAGTAPLASQGSGAAPGSSASGRLRLTFTERSSLSSSEEVARRLSRGGPATRPIDTDPAADYDLKRQTFEVIVPASYRPDVKHGVLLWVGVSEFSAEWVRLLSRHRLILVSPDDLWRRELARGPARVGLPLDGLHNVKSRYNVDKNRVYVCGFSAGAGLAAVITRCFPEEISGGLFLMGGSFYQVYVEKGRRPEASVLWEPPDWNGDLRHIKADVRLVLLRGQRDPLYRPEDDEAQYEGLVLDGFKRATYLVVPGTGHTHPPATWFEKGLAALESEPKTPPSTQPTSAPRPQAAQAAQAKRILSTARLNMTPGRPLSKTALGYLRRVVNEYPSTPAAEKARELMKEAGLSPAEADRG